MTVGPVVNPKITVLRDRHERGRRLGPGAGGASRTTTSPSGTPSDVNTRAFSVYPGGRLTGAIHTPALRSGALPSRVYRTIAVIVGGVASRSPSERADDGDWRQWSPSMSRYGHPGERLGELAKSHSPAC